MNEGKPEVKNYLEDHVDYMIMHCALECCTCDYCLADVKAIVLNSLKPMYTVTEKGQLFRKLDLIGKQSEVDIITEITRAAALVAQKPRHEDAFSLKI